MSKYKAELWVSENTIDNWQYNYGIDAFLAGYEEAKKSFAKTQKDEDLVEFYAKGFAFSVGLENITYETVKQIYLDGILTERKKIDELITALEFYKNLDWKVNTEAWQIPAKNALEKYEKDSK